MSDAQLINPLPIRGILLALGGGVTLSVNDLSIKFLSGDYALHQVILIRALVGMTIILAVIAMTEVGLAQLRTKRPGAHLLRVAIVMVSNVTYFLGLAAMPIADAVALAFIAPVLITAMSALILREPVGPRRWAAVGVGLLGVVVMMRPGNGVIQPAAVLILISALCYAASHTMTRILRGTESAFTLNFYVQCGFICVSSCMGLWVGDGHMAGSSDPSLAFLFRDWVWPPVRDWPFFLASGLAVGIGGLMMSQAYRLCEAALVAPFEYIGIPMAIFWGAVVFGTFPDRVAWAGIVLICGAGLYTFWRETVRKKERT
ncbi:DMT family transporter [Aliigemmobacter aestuarii]|uniref:DMT family transporter n=1 Tax=Aliigemmobacter aestuarii TaxID=1445661 RepID=A0A4S3MSU0_9RHOB|nr:DMT family transporter [Gemmobacter aestuarii]THD85547.1 DMT family transporter [Gemmobacter aestuarii]